MFLEASYCKVFATLRPMTHSLPPSISSSDHKSLIQRFLHTVVCICLLLYRVSWLFRKMGEVLQAACDAPERCGLKSKRDPTALVLPVLCKGDPDRTGPEKMKYSVTIEVYWAWPKYSVFVLYSMFHQLFLTSAANSKLNSHRTGVTGLIFL